MANIDSASLFPIVPSEPLETSKGIARLALSSFQIGRGHDVEFRSLSVRSLINKSVSRRGLWFSKTINPYRGCEFACRYCYARYTHEFMELRNPEDFERKIFIKQNAAWLLQQELRDLHPGEEIAIGTATDPYQPIERKAKITRSLLEVFAGRRGLRIGIVTKSSLIARDIDLLERIAERNELVIHLTITTPDAALARILGATRTEARFAIEDRSQAAEGRLAGGDSLFPAAPWIDRYPTGAGRDGAPSEKRRCQLLLRRATVLETLFAGDLPGLRSRALSRA